jgi:hypothetical protein
MQTIIKIPTISILFGQVFCEGRESRKLDCITPKIYIVAIFVIVDIETILHTQYISTLINYPHSPFHMISSNFPLVIAFNLTAKEKIRTVNIVLFYTRNI